MNAGNSKEFVRRRKYLRNNDQAIERAVQSVVFEMRQNRLKEIRAWIQSQISKEVTP